MAKKKRTLPQTIYAKIVTETDVTYLSASEVVDEITETDASTVGVYELKEVIRAQLIVHTETID